MKTKMIDGAALAAKMQKKLKARIQLAQRPPALAVILVGDNPASHVYVKHKTKKANEVGISSATYMLSPVVTQDALIAFVKDLNGDPGVDGILVQLPLPPHINTDAVLEAISPEKDADGLNSCNLGRLFAGYPARVPCTPMACMALIQSVCKNLAGKNAVVVGRSRLVGKPLSQLLLEANATVTQAHSRTRGLAKICKRADILVTAVGKPGLISARHVKKGAIVIDVGISRLADGKLAGDVNAKSVRGVARALSPVPGGVGPMTVAMLLQNIADIYCQKQNL